MEIDCLLSFKWQILNEAEQTPLKNSSRGLTYDLLCAMANPNQTDTQGVSQLSEVAERFAYSLLTDIKCGTEGKRWDIYSKLVFVYLPELIFFYKHYSPLYSIPRGITILDNCPYFTIAAHHWYPMQINGHTFIGKNTDTFTLPETLLEVPALPADSTAPSACHKVHFTEYSTEHWFLTNKKPSALNGKVKNIIIVDLSLKGM